MSSVFAISSARDRVGESPVWSVATQALYWVDIEGQRIHRLDWASRTQSSWALAERVGELETVTPAFAGRVERKGEAGAVEARGQEAPDVAAAPLVDALARGGLLARRPAPQDVVEHQASAGDQGELRVKPGKR